MPPPDAPDLRPVPRRRVLVFSGEMPPAPGRIVAGGGLRVQGLIEGLRAAGHEVLLSLAEPLLERLREPPRALAALAHTPATVPALVQRLLPDVVLFEQWGLLAAVEPLPVPVVVDLPGPLILENHFRGHGTLEANALAKTAALAKADCFLCSSDAQRRYLVPWLLLAGVAPEDLPQESVPLGLDPALPTPEPSDEPLVVSAGLQWPWQDPFAALHAALELLARRGHGRLRVVAGPHRDNLGISTAREYSRALPSARAEDFHARLGTGPVECSDLVPIDELEALYRRAWVVLDVQRPNAERDLAFPTRTVHALWCGAPVLHSRRSELAPLIERYEAGWCVDPERPAELAAALAEALDDPAVRAHRAAGARRLVREQFLWTDTARPLVRFVAQPGTRARGAAPLQRLALLDRFERLIGDCHALLQAQQEQAQRLAAAQERLARGLGEELAEARAELARRKRNGNEPEA